MAKEIITRLRDDLDGSEATKTLVFAWAGATYEIDLSDDNAEKFSAAIAPYVGAARKLSGRGRRRVAEAIVEAYDDAQAALAKTGAAPRGTPTARKAALKRGRIAESIVEAYDDAQAALAKIAEAIVEAYDDAQAALAKTGAAPRRPRTATKAAAKKAAPNRRRVAESIVEAYDDAQAALAKTGAAPRKAPAKKA